MSNIINLFSKRKEVTEEVARNSGENGDGFQMSLPFSPAHVLFLIDADIEVENEELVYFISHECIKTFFDLRFSPRLDFISSTRQKAFLEFKRIGLSYIDIFGRTGLANYKTALEDKTEVIKDIIVYTERNLEKKEACMMMFDHPSLAREYRKLLSQYYDVRCTNSNSISEINLLYNKIQM